MAGILIIEDEPEMARALRDNLEFEDHTVWDAETGIEGVELAAAKQPDLVLLDIMLPDIDGFEVCQRLRQGGFRAPIIILSARGQELDKVRGLELGADDYVTKPFSLRELLARVEAVLRRMQRAQAEAETELGITGVHSLGEWQVDFDHQRLIRSDGGRVTLGYYETELLRALFAQEAQAVPRRELMAAVWGVDLEPSDRTIDNHIVSLRRKIEADPKRPRHILTAHAVGYKLVR